MKGTKLAIGALIGAAAGVVAGILTAPKSGKETRDDIKFKADDILEHAALKKNELLDKADEITAGVRSKAIDTIENVKSSKNNQK